MVTADSLWVALGLALVLEGLFPFVAPARWRGVLLQILQLRDGQIRFYALLALLVGSLLLFWA